MWMGSYATTRYGLEMAYKEAERRPNGDHQSGSIFRAYSCFEFGGAQEFSTCEMCSRRTHKPLIPLATAPGQAVCGPVARVVLHHESQAQIAVQALDLTPECRDSTSGGGHLCKAL